MLSARILGLLIAAAVVAMAGLAARPFAEAGGTCHKGRPVTSERGDAVTMVGNCFVATVLRTDAGQPVTWINEDDAGHTVTGANYTWGSDEKMHKGDTLTFTFAAEGVYPYYCFLHPGMVGAVVVGDGNKTGETTLVASDDFASFEEVVSEGVAERAGPAAAPRLGEADVRPAPVTGDGGNSNVIMAGGVVLIALGLAGGCAWAGTRRSHQS